MAKAVSGREAFFSGTLDLREYAVGRPFEIAGCRVSAAPARHYMPAYAMRVEMDGATLAYSADTAPCDEVASLAAGSDLFLCEASLGASGSDGEIRGHLNAEEAGILSAAAGVGHLVLTHYDDMANADELRAAAARAFDGRISIADDGQEYPFN